MEMHAKRTFWIAALAILLSPAGPVRGGGLAAAEVSEFSARANKDQTQDAFAAWLKADPARPEAFARFRAHLDKRGVGDVAPAFQLWRTSSSAPRCQTEGFVVPDEAYWDNVVGALVFIRDRVKPAIGDVEILSGYRNETLNRCSGGSSGSAHRRYFALDMVPIKSISRKDLIRSICKAHGAYGAEGRIGLGFYSGVRFHIDAMRFRRWGPDRTGATSPCNQIAS